MFHKYSDYLREKYGEKVYKLPVNLPVSCPNRENGSGGCAFCSEKGTGFEAEDCRLSVTEQLEAGREHISHKYHAEKYIAYFQNYTNTYMPPEAFASYLKEASAFPGVVEIAVSTRPDCLSHAHLDTLKKIHEEYRVNVTIELGLQTVNYHVLRSMNRGHGLAEFIAAMQLLSAYPFLEICVHLILNLPGDTIEDTEETAKIISLFPVKCVKLHSLYIAKNTRLCDWYENGKITLCPKEEYIKRVIRFLELSRSDLVIERFFSRIPEEDSVFSNWNTSWWKLMDELCEAMKLQNTWQGKYYGTLYDKGLKEP